jgi:ATP-binding cassette subfamily B multidrug efflux pump
MGELKSLNKYILRYKWRMLAGVLFIVFSNWFNLYPAKIFREAIDIVIENLKVYKLFSGTSLQEDYYQTLLYSFLLFGIFLLVSALLKGVFTFFMRYTIIMVSRFIEYDIKNEIYKKYQELDVSFYKQNKTGDIMNRIGDDVGKVRMYLGPSIMYLVNLIVLFIMVIWTMVDINPTLSLYVLLPLPIMSVVIFYVSKYINLKSEFLQKQLSNIFSITQETFSGIRVVKSYNKTEDILKDFEKEADSYKQNAMSLVKTESLFQPVIMFLPVLSTIITIYAGGLAVIDGKITYGNIAEFVIYINLLTWPVASLGWVTSLIQRASASMKRINEFLDIQPAIQNSTDEIIDFNGKIEFKNVSFIYPENNVQALQNVSFTIEPGQTLGIIGKTGSGKSTILNLINRLYDVNFGEILIDNQNIKNINLFHWRKQIGMVPQDVFLFSDTIENNICFGVHDEIEDEKFKKERVIQAAKDADVHQNILDLPQQYQTLLGERGVTLSGGQKQRVSIARALVKNPNLLMLDDCLSAVDTETEENILNNLKRIMQNKTSLIVSHRITSLMHADKILVIEDGKILEEGTHSQLLELKKSYYELYTKQSI